MAGVYANFANISFSDYEFTVTFARIDHEVEEGDIPGVVVSRMNMSPQFLEELLEAMQDSWSKWSSRAGDQEPPRDRRPLLARKASAIAIRLRIGGCVPNERPRSGGSGSASAASAQRVVSRLEACGSAPCVGPPSRPRARSGG